MGSRNIRDKREERLSIKERTMYAAFVGIEALIKIPMFRSAYNHLFDRLPYRHIRYLGKSIDLPDSDYTWDILLMNGRKIMTNVWKGDSKTRKFAKAYRWHDPSQTYFEYELAKHLKSRGNAYWIDCGANLGLRSLIALSMEIPVVFVEPNEEVSRLNRERCDLNAFGNYEFLPFGVSDTDGQKTFFIDKSSYLSSLQEGLFKEKALLKKEVIETRRLDTLLHERLISNRSIAYVKIDVESHEWEVLMGAQRIIEDVGPTFMIEIGKDGDRMERIFSFMRMHGYDIYETLQRDATQSVFLRSLTSGDDHRTPVSGDFVFVKDRQTKSLLDGFSS
jgi:FkbM family methyltransferase